MKVLVIQTSNRPDGYTGSLAKAVLDGAVEKAAARSLQLETEWVNLNEYDIQVCKAHGEKGWGVCRQGEPCVLQDDFETLHKKVIATDALVFASPVYFGDLSESARTFLDRLRRVEWPLRENNRVHGKRIIGVVCAGGSGRGSVNAIRNLENYMSYFSFDNVAYIPVSRQNYPMQLVACKEAGRHLIDVMAQPS